MDRCEKLSVIAIHISTSSQPLIVTENFCNTFEKLNYEIAYAHVNSIDSNLTNSLNVLSSICSSLVIYCEASDETQVKELIDLVNHENISLFQRVTVMLLSEIQVLNSSITNANVRFLNIVPLKRKREYKYFTRYNIQGVNILSIPQAKLTAKTIYLSCAWWFEFFINNAFNCAKGRLLQYAGTCFFNVVMNQIILGKNLSTLVKKAIEETIQKNPSVKDFLEEDPSLLNKCPVKFDSAYMIRLLYQVLINFTTFEKNVFLPSDFMLEASKEEGFGEKIMGEPTGESDNSFKVITKLFNSLNINFTIVDFSQGFKEYYKYGYDMSKDDYDFQLIDIPSNEQRFDVVIALDYCKPMLDIYKLESAILRCNIGDESHVFLGFICDNDYKIYDSYTNRIFHLEWSKIQEKKDEITKILKNELFKESVKNLEIVYCLYIR